MAKGESDKVDYETWQRWREKIKLLHELGFSWNELSKLHGKSERGYIASAYEHRSIVEPGILKLTDELLQEEDVKTMIKQKERLNGKALAPSRGEDMKERLAKAREVADALRDEFGLTWGEASEAFGYAPSTLSSMLRGKSPDPPAWDKIKRGMTELQRRRGGETRNPWVGRTPENLDELNARDKALTDPRNAENAQAARKALLPETVPPDPWAWLDKIQNELLELASQVLAEGQKVPEAFRGPYNAKADALLEFAEKEFKR